MAKIRKTPPVEWTARYLKSAGIDCTPDQAADTLDAAQWRRLQTAWRARQHRQREAGTPTLTQSSWERLEILRRRYGADSLDSLVELLEQSALVDPAPAHDPAPDTPAATVPDGPAPAHDSVPDGPQKIRFRKSKTPRWTYDALIDGKPFAEVRRRKIATGWEARASRETALLSALRPLTGRTRLEAARAVLDIDC